MLLRTKRRMQLVRLDDRGREDGSAPIQLTSPTADPEGELGSQEVSQVLKTEIRRIPPLLRNIILLRDIGGVPMTEVAEQLGITVPAAKSRLLRARGELRLRMARHCGRTGAWSLMTVTAAPPNRTFH
jgi:RNA polymerase sigma-70 factor (ECF subfamily)